MRLGYVDFHILFRKLLKLNALTVCLVFWESWTLEKLLLIDKSKTEIQKFSCLGIFMPLYSWERGLNEHTN